jgi:hypothetical protein
MDHEYAMEAEKKLSAPALSVAVALAAFWALGATTAPSADPGPATRPTKDLGLYDGFDADAAMLRDVHELKKPDGNTIRGSSPKAQGAAHRIFSRIAFLYRSRDEILQMLGDPRTLSDYGQAAGKDKNDPLVYKFDSGDAGQMYTLGFSGDRCVSVTVDFLE